VNVDLPWNPAVLEQRIARAHRMGQRRPVQVFLLVTEQTLEENLLATLAMKHELATAVLDPDSDVEAVDMLGSMEAAPTPRYCSTRGPRCHGASARRASGGLRESQRERLAATGGALVAPPSRSSARRSRR
jgi:hypothetical protein